MQRVLKYNLIVLLLSIGLIELFSQMIGYPSWIVPEKTRVADNWMMPDDTLGWRNRPGQWTLVESKSGARFSQTFLSDSRRFSGESANAKTRVVFIGDSYVQGYGLSDADTFVSKLQQKFPSIRFDNFGVPGYGTYQSFLMMKEVLLSPERKPDHIYYVFNAFHELRNVGDLSQIRRLIFSKDDLRQILFVTIDDHGVMTEQRFKGLPFWMLSQYSSIVALLDDIYHSLLSQMGVTESRKITKSLVQSMSEMASKKGVKFSVILLDVSEFVSKDYAEYLMSYKIDYQDCSVVSRLGKQYRLSDGHPNGEMNIKIAECLYPRFDSIVSDR